MTVMHGEHALIETAAAIVLSVGGALMVGLAWRQRRSGTWPTRPDGRPERRPSVALLVAVLSGAAAGIHLAAGPDHVEALGDVGLGFYWAALFQAGFAVAWLAAGPSRRLALLGVVGNGAILAAWLASRTVGLPFLESPEPIGLADGICAALELTVLGFLVLAHPSWRGQAMLRRAPSIGVSGIVAIAGVAVLASVIAIADVGHGHMDGIHPAAAAHQPSP